jgi:hypothetical protein
MSIMKAWEASVAIAIATAIAMFTKGSAAAAASAIACALCGILISMTELLFFWILLLLQAPAVLAWVFLLLAILQQFLLAPKPSAAIPNTSPRKGQEIEKHLGVFEQLLQLRQRELLDSHQHGI